MTHEDLIKAARESGATVLETASAIVFVLPVRTVVFEAEWISLEHAAKLALTSVRVIKEAIRDGSLPAFGGQRDRTVRRCDVKTWIESRRHTRTSAPTSADAEREAEVERILERRAREKKENSARGDASNEP